MYTRILSFAFVALVAFAPTANAQTVDLESMLNRMQTIMEEMAKLQAEFKTITSQISASEGAGTVLGASTSALEPVFTLPLEYGETNDDIKRIQELLATDPEIYDHPYVTGFFGPKTEAAIKNLQTRFGLDPVGIIGPATTKLLQGYFRAYPNGNYPDGVLTTKPPAVLGASTSNSGSSDVLKTLQDKLASLQTTDTEDEEEDDKEETKPKSKSGTSVKSIEVEFKGDNAYITLKQVNGLTRKYKVEADDEDEVLEYLVDETDYDEDELADALDVRSGSSRGGDEDDAEAALEDAEEAIDDADEEIDEARDDGDDTDWAEDTLDEAEDLLEEAEEAFDDEDWDEAIELAEEAEEMAEEAIDRIDEEKKTDSDDIDEIIAYLGNNESIIVVVYDDGDEDEFDLDTDEEDDVIEEVADELDIDEDEVEDLIDFRGKKVDEINVLVKSNESDIEVRYEDDSVRNYSMDETDEDDIVSSLAISLRLPKSEVRDLVDFD